MADFLVSVISKTNKSKLKKKNKKNINMLKEIMLAHVEVNARYGAHNRHTLKTFLYKRNISEVIRSNKSNSDEKSMKVLIAIAWNQCTGIV